MLFNSLDYLLFLTLALAGWWALARHGLLRLLFVFLASCVFYTAYNPWYIGLILGSTVVDWYVAKRIHAHATPPGTEGPYRDAPPSPERARAAETMRKRWLSVSIVLNLGLLGTFKYFDFGSRAIADALALLHIHVEPVLLDVALPVGISFYTFESLSYCVDVYRGKTAPAQTPLKLLFFITFFPKLVAGPIARPADLLPQVDRTPTIDRRHVSEGLFLIVTGMAKKIVLADYVSVNLVDRVFDNPEAFSGTEVIVGLYGFTLQIYADFSGYTDIARGSAKLFGIELPENFDRPYQSKSPAEFWRRWHMTLSTWLRDYLYFPLGGSKLGEARTYLNLWLTIFLIGLWHGASWTFVVYGALQATAVVLHRLSTRLGRGVAKERGARRTRGAKRTKGAKTNDAETKREVEPRWLLVLKVVGTLQFVVFSRILFRAADLGNAGDIVERMVSGTSSLAQIPWTVWLVLLVGFGLHYTPRSWYTRVRDRFVAQHPVVQGLSLAIAGGVLMRLASAQSVPYIYFQF